jgi:hypothetical protein
MLPAKVGSIWPSSFRGEDVLTLANQKQDLLFVSDWLLLKTNSPLKLLGQMEPNLAGSISVSSSIKFLRFVPFCQQIWLIRANSILHSCFLPSLVPFGQGVSGEKICLTLANQKQELLLAAIFVGKTEREQVLFLIG